jgi:pimeloyl-ACP methyl ester carboxylesterase
MLSNSWEGLAQLLVAEGQARHTVVIFLLTDRSGFFVVAPNLLAHAGRKGNTDYRISAFAEDLRPYFVMDTSYDVIIGHSFGGAVAVSLLPFLPKKKETTVILLDPGLESTEEQNKINFNLFLKETGNIKPVDVHMVKNPAWSRRDCVFRTLGLTMCDRTAVEVFRVILQLSK